MTKASLRNGRQYASSLWMVIASIVLGLEGGECTLADIEKHLELGRELLNRGQLTDALSHYHAAVEGDPSNYLTYFKRATVYLALAKSKSALPDLDRVIELKPDFTAARLQRGSVLLKQGNLDEAHIDFEAVLRKEPNNLDALRHYQLLDSLKHDIEVAHVFAQDGNHHAAIELLSKVIEVCPWDPILREMRADAFIAVGELGRAINDIKPTTKLRNDNTKAYLKLSSLYYQIGDADESLNEIRECLKLDPDHKDCFALYKKVKKLANQIKAAHEMVGNEQFEDCIAKTEQMLLLEPSVTPFVFKAKALQCQCALKAGKISDAISACTEALRIEESAYVLCDRAEAHIANEELEDAVNDYRRAHEVDEHLERAKEGLQRSQKLLKQSKKRDYYKILGVRRNANKKDVLKAYRKAAQKWHPDNFQGDEKKAAEKKFIDIAAAKEVLSDPEKREKYDNGEDPLDPESQAGQGFNPFGQGFHPFGGGGGPFQFKFHFN